MLGQAHEEVAKYITLSDIRVYLYIANRELRAFRTNQRTTPYF
jgi:hypothetical protein